MIDQSVLNALERAFDKVGITKAEGVMSTTDLATGGAGGFMSPVQVDALINNVKAQNQWLTKIRMRAVAVGQTQIPKISLGTPVTRFVDEGDNTLRPVVPTTTHVPITCRKARSDWIITYEDIQAAKASGVPNFEKVIFDAFSTQIGNDIAQAAMQGDTTYTDDGTITAELIRGRDGFMKQAKASAHSLDCAGKTFAAGMFPKLRSLMPWKWASDPLLNWLMPDILDISWMAQLSNVYSGVPATALGDRAATSRGSVPPFGVPQIICPGIPTDIGEGSNKTSVFLTNPKNLTVCTEYGMRAARKYRQEDDTFLITVFWKLDFVIQETDACVYAYNLGLPTFAW